MGQTFTASATVVADNAPVGSGTVTFGYAGSSSTASLSDGVASTTFTAEEGPTPRHRDLQRQLPDRWRRARHQWRPGPVVAGVSATRGGTRRHRRRSTVAGVSGTRASGAAGLAGTGLDAQTELYGVLGLGLVTVGGLTLLVHRRRVQA